MAGNSLLGVVLPLRMETADYPVALTGAVMAAYYLGLALGGLRAKRVILRIGHIRAFSIFAAMTAAVCLAYGFCGRRSHGQRYAWSTVSASPA